MLRSASFKLASRNKLQVSVNAAHQNSYVMNYTIYPVFGECHYGNTSGQAFLWVGKL